MTTISKYLLRECCVHGCALAGVSCAFSPPCNPLSTTSKALGLEGKTEGQASPPTHTHTPAVPDLNGCKAVHGPYLPHLA